MIDEKWIFAATLALASFVGFQSVSEAASVSPSNQEVRGTTGTATWNLTWSGSGAHAVRFNPGDGSGNRTIDSNNTIRVLRNIQHTYRTNQQLKTWTANFSVTNLSNQTQQVTSARVVHRLP